jgi:hypothetical protein
VTAADKGMTANSLRSSIKRNLLMEKADSDV